MALIPETYRFSPRTRKWMLFLHIITGVGWMGVDIALFILVIGARMSDSAERVGASYLAVGYIGAIAVPILSIAMTLTGIALSLGMGLGLKKYWWVLTKLGIALVLCALVYIALLPELTALPDKIDLGMTADQVRDSLGASEDNLLFPPIVSFSMMAIASTLSIFKPWGRTPWSKRTPKAATAAR